MTKSEIYSAVRNLLNEQSEDAGALLKGESNLADFVNDATEQVVLDLLPDMPRQFCKTELVSLVANDEDYTLTNEFWMILKVEKNVTDDMPVPVDIISPLQADEYTKVAETADEPTAVFFVGSTMYVRPIPATAKANYLKIYEVVPEAAALADTGPVYVPRPAHRMIVYWAAALAAISAEVSPSTFLALYEKRKEQVFKIYETFQHQTPQFLNASYRDRSQLDVRERAFTDLRWR